MLILIRLARYLTQSARVSFMAIELLFKGGKDVGRTERFSFDSVTVGSSPLAHLKIDDDPMISPEHFVIERTGHDTYRIQDLKSQHGTFVDDQRITTSALRDKAIIRAGLTVLQVALHPEAVEPQLVEGVPEDDPLPQGWGPGEPNLYEQLQPDDDLQLRAALSSAVEPLGYDLGRLLGKGSFGRVYQATVREGGKSVAIKVLDGIPSESPKKLQLFLREISVQKVLDHPHIVKLLNTGMIQDRIAWFVMEYVDGLNLKDCVARAGGRLEMRDACTIVRQVLEGLDCAHCFPPPLGPFVHRDVKPKNILVSGGPTARHARLADFGLAKNFAQAGWSGITVTGRPVGTLEFMSLEQLKDSKYAGPEVDVYAMGAVLHYCLTGRILYDVDSPAVPSALLDAILRAKILPLKACRSDLPDSLQVVVDRAVGRDNIRRFRTARQMVLAIDDVLNSSNTVEASDHVG
jgi:pSer/pThr/pTyr-binding forkhead associated (FHA) protein